MAEGKAGPRSPGVPDGWESDSSSDEYRNYSGSGRGATTHDLRQDQAGEGSYGSGRGADYLEPTAVVPGEDAPEFPLEG